MQYQEYGYNYDRPSYAHNYIYMPLKEILRRNHAKTVLDIGCGNGNLTRRIIRDGFNAYGFDASAKGIAIAKQEYSDRFFQHDISDHQLPAPLRSYAFDAIISIEVIEHLYNPNEFLRLCKNILLKGGSNGLLILSTPYHGYLKNLAIALSGGFDRHFNSLRVGGHIKFWSRKSMTKLLEGEGFAVEEFKGAGRFQWLWKSMIIAARVSNTNGDEPEPIAR